MTKRISRKALALAAIGALAAPAFATVANAQIITKTIAVTLKAVGPVPTGVTGATVSVVCVNTTSTPGAITSTFPLTPGQTANLNNFLLTSAAPGSSCTVTATNAGSANTNKGTVTISVGGATSGAGFATGASPVTAGPVAVFDSTDVQITMSFPQITVKKVVVGDEATAGFSYPMSIACSNPGSSTFVSPANGLEGGNVTIATSTSTSSTRAFRAAAQGQRRTLTLFFPGGTRVVSYFSPGVGGPIAVPVIVAPSTDAISGTVPAASTAGTPIAAAITAAVNTSDVAVGSASGTLIPGSTTVYYGAGDIVVPGTNAQNYVLVPFYTLVAGVPTIVPASTVAIFDPNTTGALPTIAGVTAANTILGTALNVAGIVAPAGAVWNGPATTLANGVTLTPGQLVSTIPAVIADNYVNGVLANAANFTTGSTTAGSIIVYPYNYTGVVAPGGIIGNWANLGTGNPSLYTQVVNAINANLPGQPTPNTAAGFTGSFTLKGGASQSFSFNEFPNLTTASKCEVWETNSGGASVTAFSSTNGTAAPLAGLNNANGRFQSNLTAMNETITVTNSFLGDMIISKVVTGDPKTNIATYEISVACDKGGPKDTFLIKDRQSKVYSGIASGTNCLITETKSDGAVASYKDNSGDNTTDGRVTIKRRPIGGCGDVLGVTGAPTAATPGGPAPTTTFNECWASVIVTNDYNPPATTEAPKAPAAAPATAAPATAAPAVAPAPAVAVDATPTFAG